MAAEGEVCDLVVILGCCRPAAWFAFAESKFPEKAVLSQRRCFDLFLAAMRENILDQVMDVVESYPYDTLKTRLLETHTLLEKMDILFNSETLGGRKPSQMLANMLAYYCHSGMEHSVTLQICSSSVCRSSYGHCWGNRSSVTSEVIRPGRSNFWPLAGSSPMIWWPMWKWPRPDAGCPEEGA
jgi:hypothetical protein